MADEAELADNARHRKLIAEAEIKTQQAEIERIKKEKLIGSLVPLADVEATFLEAGARVKSHLSRLVYSLPPRLEGLTGAAMIEILMESVDGVLFALSEGMILAEGAEPAPAVGEDLEEEILE